MSHDHNREIRFSHNVLPTVPAEDTSVPMGPVTRKIRRAESALQQRVEFEALVSRISGMFVRLKSDEVDAGIHEALRQMGEFLGVDHCHVCRIHNSATLLDHTHEWSASGKLHAWAGTANLSLDEHLPWVARRLRRLDGIAVYDIRQLSADAAIDRQTFLAQGIRSVIFVPMAIQGELSGCIGLDSTRVPMNWSEDAIALLKIVAAIIADALERRRAELALRKENEFSQALLNGTGALIIVLDSEGRIVRFNPAAEAASGCRFRDVVGRTPWDVFVPRDERSAYKRHFRKLASGSVVRAYEGTMMTPDGTRRTVSWSNTALMSPDGSDVEFVIMSGIDVTDTKRLEAEVLNVAEMQQSRFGHDLHDGLGQHLTGIEFMVQVLKQKLEQRGRPEAGDLEEITRLIREAITQTRDLARGLSPLILQSKGLAVALEDLARSTSRHLAVNCVCRMSSPPPDPGPGIAIHLYRIAQEAVANAVKHGAATEITISLRETANRMELSIEDNGCGFPEGFTGGSGMGLRVMQYRAGIIGGTVRATQRSSGGVVVTCALDRPLRGETGRIAESGPID